MDSIIDKLLDSSKEKTGVDYISKERNRQIDVEGFSIEDDVEMYPNGEMCFASVAYALPNNSFKHNTSGTVIHRDEFFPWNEEWFKPSNDKGIDGRIKELAKAGALLAGEIDRLLEVKKKETK